jgi:hypothetical protein
MMILIKAKKGVTIRRPDNGKVLSMDGEHVAKTPFWIRQIKSGDVIEVVSKPLKVVVEKDSEEKPEEKTSSKKESKKSEVKTGGAK